MVKSTEIVTRTLDEVREHAQVSRKRRTPKNEDDIRKAAEADPDTWLPSGEELKRFKPWRERVKTPAPVLSEDERKFDEKK